MTRQELIKNLNYCFENSQPSERFAMYRLITPVVDFANELKGLNAYFEYNQTSEHRSHQSVDIALLGEDKPIVLIEAKRLRRRLSADQINKYLLEKTRGIVTDGENWILCLNGKNKNVNILSQFGKVSDSELNEIISDTQKEEEGLHKKSEKVETIIEERLLTAYKRIRSNARNGLAVVPVQRDACGGCFNQIPPQRQLDIKSRKKIIVCEYCGRILVDDEIIREGNI